MNRKLIVFGNGLGMALDSNFFQLKRAVKSVWGSRDILNERQKELIQRCLPESLGGGPPEGEEHFDVLHQVILGACDILEKYDGEGEGPSFLSSDAKGLSSAVRTFISAVAYRFHDKGQFLPEDFVVPLVKFIKKSRSHVATLNYDNLLYQPFIEGEILAGYDGCLIDGLLGRGFTVGALDRKPGKNLGYYLCLHGSPLFVERGGDIVKRKQKNAKQAVVESRHIVMTHIKHKRSVIDESRLLSEYWRRLGQALDEVSEVIVFGYSGRDSHLNEFLRVRSQGKRFCVVEWRGAGEYDGRIAFWEKELGGDIGLEPLDDILDFKDWDG